MIALSGFVFLLVIRLNALRVLKVAFLTTQPHFAQSIVVLEWYFWLLLGEQRPTNFWYWKAFDPASAYSWYLHWWFWGFRFPFVHFEFLALDFLEVCGSQFTFRWSLMTCFVWRFLSKRLADQGVHFSVWVLNSIPPPL